MVKKLSYGIMILLMLAAVPMMSACDNDDDKNNENIVNAKELPEAANSFIETYFANTSILKVVKTSYNGVITYEVDFSNGQEADFDKDGNWTEIDAPDGQTIPDGIAPAEISSYVSSNYPDAGINEIEKTVYGYKVELTNKTELHFDSDGNLM